MSEEIQTEKSDSSAPSGRLHPLVSRLGVTVAELKRHIANWPETDAMGEPTQIWIETGEMLSSPCMTIELLNYRIKEDGSPTSDLLLCPANAEVRHGAKDADLD
jgi:hypothetical protein